MRAKTLKAILRHMREACVRLLYDLHGLHSLANTVVVRVYRDIDIGIGVSGIGIDKAGRWRCVNNGCAQLGSCKCTVFRMGACFDNTTARCMPFYY